MLLFDMRKFNLFFIVLSFAVFIMSCETSAVEKCDTNCTKCHTLSSEQAKTILSELIPDVKITLAQPAPISGLWEIEFESGGKKGLLFLDYSFKRIISGSILDIKTKVNLTQESFLKRNPPPPPAKIDLTQIPLNNALVMGDKNAKHKIYVFDDPD